MHVAAQQCALCPCGVQVGRSGLCWRAEKLEARKLLEKAKESHRTRARGVGHGFALFTTVGRRQETHAYYCHPADY